MDITQQASGRARNRLSSSPLPLKEAAKITEIAGSRFTPHTSDIQKNSSLFILYYWCNLTQKPSFRQMSEITKTWQVAVPSEGKEEGSWLNSTLQPTSKADPVSSEFPVTSSSSPNALWIMRSPGMLSEAHLHPLQALPLDLPAIFGPLLSHELCCPQLESFAVCFSQRGQSMVIAPRELGHLSCESSTLGCQRCGKACNCCLGRP